MEPPKIWRERRGKYLGIGVECSECSTKYFPLTENCVNCGSGNVKEYKIDTNGKVLHFTKVTQTTNEMMASAPHLIALIELEDGIRITGQIVDSEHKDVKEGMKVRMVFRILARNGKEGLIQYSFKFAPI